MRIDQLLLVRGELRRPEAAPFRVLRASLAGSWSGNSIEATNLALESPEGTIDLSARIGARAPKLQHLQAKFRWRAGEHQWAGTLAATGASETLELSAALDLPVKVRLASTLAPAPARGTVTRGACIWRWSVSIHVRSSPAMHFIPWPWNWTRMAISKTWRCAAC